MAIAKRVSSKAKKPAPGILERSVHELRMTVESLRHTMEGFLSGSGAKTPKRKSAKPVTAKKVVAKAKSTAKKAVSSTKAAAKSAVKSTKAAVRKSVVKPAKKLVAKKLVGSKPARVSKPRAKAPKAAAAK